MYFRENVAYFLVFFVRGRKDLSNKFVHVFLLGSLLERNFIDFNLPELLYLEVDGMQDQKFYFL